MKEGKNVTNGSVTRASGNISQLLFTCKKPVLEFSSTKTCGGNHYFVIRN